MQGPPAKRSGKRDMRMALGERIDRVEKEVVEKVKGELGVSAWAEQQGKHLEILLEVVWGWFFGVRMY